jgi:hypothetical protein
METDTVKYVSLGGWCGTRMALNQLGLTKNQANGPFDFIRASVKGITECIKNDFKCYFPESKTIDTRFKVWKPFIGYYFSFFHYEDMNDKSVIDSFNRKINRFKEWCGSSKIIFVRTCVIPDYERELAEVSELVDQINISYPALKYVILFIIPDQPQTKYCKNIGDKIFIFALDDEYYSNDTAGEFYRAILNYNTNIQLFETIPPVDNTVEIVRPTTKYILEEDIPTLKYYEELPV